MTLSILFWILFIIGFIFNGYRLGRTWIYDSLFWWVMIGILGYGVFGSPLK